MIYPFCCWCWSGVIVPKVHLKMEWAVSFAISSASSHRKKPHIFAQLSQIKENWASWEIATLHTLCLFFEKPRIAEKHTHNINTMLTFRNVHEAIFLQNTKWWTRTTWKARKHDDKHQHVCCQFCCRQCPMPLRAFQNETIRGRSESTLRTRCHTEVDTTYWDPPDGEKTTWAWWICKWRFLTVTFPTALDISFQTCTGDFEVTDGIIHTPKLIPPIGIQLRCTMKGWRVSKLN